VWKNASDPQTLRNLDEHRVFSIYSTWGAGVLGDVQRQPKHVRVGLADVNEAREIKVSTNRVKLELANAIRIHRARFVADHDDLEPVPDLELGDQIDHPGVRFRLREHKSAETVIG